MHAGGTQDGRAEPEVAQRDFAHRRERRRHAAPASVDMEWTSTRYGLLQHPRQRVARGEGEIGRPPAAGRQVKVTGAATIPSLHYPCRSAQAADSLGW